MSTYISYWDTVMVSTHKPNAWWLRDEKDTNIFPVGWAIISSLELGRNSHRAQVVNELFFNTLWIKNDFITPVNATLGDVGFWYTNKPRSRAVLFASDYRFAKTKRLSSVSWNFIPAQLLYGLSAISIVLSNYGLWKLPERRKRCREWEPGVCRPPARRLPISMRG